MYVLFARATCIYIGIDNMYLYNSPMSIIYYYYTEAAATSSNFQFIANKEFVSKSDVVYYYRHHAQHTG